LNFRRHLSDNSVDESVEIAGSLVEICKKPRRVCPTYIVKDERGSYKSKLGENGRIARAFPFSLPAEDIPALIRAGERNKNL
jgi:hypothetical protein